MTRFKQPESVLVVVYTRAGDFLLLERHEPAGWWQSVTGSLEPGESPGEAAVRELAEETGLDADGLADLEMNHRFTIAPAWRHKFAPGVSENLEHAFALELPEPAPIRLDAAEHRAFAWLPLDEALSRASSWSNRAALQRIASEKIRAG
ncbi:dihydroneopterin triphosphate diphosphatase [Thioalkalivibrio sp. XN279]|uniref:dihydroneopterin triphosphate diphosphatase n=1 Tax=Thioalkalivibrio sp. XN279 TaxID=2714953 RepID=UPI001408973D|nr:dihydroneopterin triphosphate diphosphatase [Thioalkalivibrio sp. XN279]NHA16026.1 dihydroneopterin triphosphate diphosphatase [Thioalkalivibrio sp. XN279]